MFVRPSCWYGSTKSDKWSPRKCLILSKNARKHFAWRQTHKRQKKKNIGSSTAIERTDIWDAWIGLACSGYLSRTMAQFTYLCLHALFISFKSHVIQWRSIQLLGMHISNVYLLHFRKILCIICLCKFIPRRIILLPKTKYQCFFRKSSVNNLWEKV